MKTQVPFPIGKDCSIIKNGGENNNSEFGQRRPGYSELGNTFLMEQSKSGTCYIL